MTKRRAISTAVATMVLIAGSSALAATVYATEMIHSAISRINIDMPIESIRM